MWGKPHRVPDGTISFLGLLGGGQPLRHPGRTPSHGNRFLGPRRLSRVQAGGMGRRLLPGLWPMLRRDGAEKRIDNGRIPLVLPALLENGRRILNTHASAIGAVT